MKRRIVRDGRNESQDFSLSMRLQESGSWDGQLQKLDTLSPLGGERRLIHWRAQPNPIPEGWTCPPRISLALKKLDTAGRKFVRLMLATPAIFGAGWRPKSWVLSKSDNGALRLIGKIPGTEVKVRLISACVDRWRPISG